MLSEHPMLMLFLYLMYFQPIFKDCEVNFELSSQCMHSVSGTLTKLIMSKHFIFYFEDTWNHGIYLKLEYLIYIFSPTLANFYTASKRRLCNVFIFLSKIEVCSKHLLAIN